jgi:hypothetical protein
MGLCNVLRSPSRPRELGPSRLRHAIERSKAQHKWWVSPTLFEIIYAHPLPDYNFGNTIFLVSFLLAELPSQLVSKKIGPDRWIPTQMVLWSIVAMSQAAIKGRTGFIVTRVLLGVLEVSPSHQRLIVSCLIGFQGGFIPDIVLWLSYFYTSRELPIRLSYFWTALSTTTIVTSLAAFGIFHLEGHAGLAGWRFVRLFPSRMLDLLTHQ